MSRAEGRPQPAASQHCAHGCLAHRLPTLTQELLELHHPDSDAKSSLGVFGLGHGSILHLE